VMMKIIISLIVITITIVITTIIIIKYLLFCIDLTLISVITHLSLLVFYVIF
jgi:hypothetical protein